MFQRTGQTSKKGRSLSLDNRNSNLSSSSQAHEGSAKDRSGESQSLGGVVDYVENLEPGKRRVVNPRRIGKFERFIRRQKFFWRPPLTAEEKFDLEAKRIDKATQKTRDADMAVIGKRIIESYFNMGINYVQTSKNKLERQKIQKVKFMSWKSTSDGATYWGKVSHIPYGHNATQLVSDEALTQLSFSVGKPVKGICNDLVGVMISVSAAGTLDMPIEIDFNVVFPLISKSAPPLSVFIGIGENGTRHIYNLEELPHLLIGGTTGSGKSVALTQILATIIARNNPQDIKLLLADLKNCDLNLFEGAPHLIKDIPEIPTGVVTKDDQVVPMFKWLEAENNRRQAMFSHSHIRNLAEWNSRHKNRCMPRIVVACDEFARLMRNDRQKQEFIALTYDLASTARATGIYLILATQFAKDKYITTDIKMNIPGRLAFSVPDLQGSVALIDSNKAVNLYPPAGRGIFQHGVNTFSFQSPLISSRQILKIVEEAQQGKTLENIPVNADVTEQEIVRWALAENNGNLQTHAVYNHFSSRSERKNVEDMLREMDGKIYVIEEVEYKVLRPAGKSGRKLVKSELEDPSSAPDIIPTREPVLPGGAPEETF